jgi:hypothetical protein
MSHAGRAVAALWHRCDRQVGGQRTHPHRVLGTARADRSLPIEVHDRVVARLEEFA